MSPKRDNNREIQDSTTDFFLKVIKKEKEKIVKENPIKENTNYTKTLDKMGRFYNYINQTLDKILSNRISVMLLSLIMTVILFLSI